jgi:hypothetical protein
MPPGTVVSQVPLAHSVPTVQGDPMALGTPPSAFGFGPSVVLLGASYTLESSPPTPESPPPLDVESGEAPESSPVLA